MQLLFSSVGRGLVADDGSSIFGGGYKSGAVSIMKELHRKYGGKSEI